MLNIRKKQSDACLLNDEEEFVKFIVGHLRQESPALVGGFSDDSMQSMVSSGLKRARGYGFRSPEDLTAFVSIMFEVAPNFDEQPEIHRVLTDETVPIDQRFDLIFENASEEAWDEANEKYDYEAWYPELKEEKEE